MNFPPAKTKKTLQSFKFRISNSEFRISPFNMVEIALALAIIGIGIAGIMSLFPVGFNATRDSIGDNFSADAADQFLHWINATVTKNDTNWDNYVGDSGKITISKPSIDTPAPNGTEDLFTTWFVPANNESGTNIYTMNTSGAGYDQTFGVVQQSGDGVIDCAAVIRIWKSPIQASVFEGEWTSTTMEYSNGAALNVEISWPAQKPYTSRETRYFYLEVFKPL